ncbi:MAG: DUF11 domain-containing protein [Bacteroidetes bacterium]|nr:DUF11 domain-containing protein [Bacteroidota bacterium]
MTVAAGQQSAAIFAAQQLEGCPSLQVDLAAPFLRRCFQSTYHVHYCNYGTLTAEDAYVEVTLDPFLSAVSSSIPWTTVDGQTYTFPIGDVAVGQCGSFWLKVLVSCDAELGQTHCSEAHIFPDEICQPINPLWDGSILDVTGTCDGDSVHFTITNIGDDMQDPVGFIVIEDDMVNFSGSPIQLDAGGSYVVSVPANGSTWRVEVENAATNPFNGDPSLSVEGCGVNGSGTFSLGFVTQFPQGDPSPFVDTDCQPNVGSYDPNDKTGYPNGYCAAHFIESSQDIEYRIRFQNTGTDTAFNVVVRDTLPPTLDPATVQPGASSHAYDFELLGNGVVQFTFPDIMLPDSNANEMASHGFVSFTVAQVGTNTNGTFIQNQAAIFFDFNDPVYTNTYAHTVADDFVQSADSSGNLAVSGVVNTWYGQPLEGVNMTLSPICPSFTDANGYYISAGLNSGDYTLTPMKENDDKQEGVTVLDMLKMGDFILGLNPFNAAYQVIATEINNSGSVTTFDLVEQRKMAIGLPVGNSAQYWKFVVADFVFPAPYPLVPYPTIINYNSLTESVNDADFIAIKPGDVITESMVDSSILKPHFYFKTNPLANGLVEVEVKANDFYYVQGCQFGLTWDPTVMAFSGLVSASLSGTDINPTVPGQLQLITFVSSGTGLSLPDSTTLFTLVFNALAPVGSSTPLTLDETLLPFQVVVEDCKLAGATMGNTTVTIENPSATSDVQGNGFTMKIAPNPVRSGQPVFLETTTETARALTLQVFDVNGKLLRNWERGVPAGTSDFTVQPSLEKGLYLLKITDGNGEGKAVRLVVF